MQDFSSPADQADPAGPADQAGPAGPQQPGAAEAEVRRRVTELEHLFGDPADPANPLGSARFLAADTRAQPLPAAEQLLARYGLNAEFVPRALGGRLDQLDTLARVVRAVFRHDAALGLGQGITNFLAAVVLWAAGTPAQQAAAARLLLGGGALAAAYPELASGSDFLSNGFTATAATGSSTDDGDDGGGFLLSGRKEAFNNAARARALVLFARTGHGRHSHSVLLVEPARLPAARIRALPRHRTLGVRGCLVTGIAFDDCPVPAAALVGGPGQGLELALKVFPVIRSVGPSTALGCADTALRTAVACVLDRTEPPAETPATGPDADADPDPGAAPRVSHARATLAGAFVDLLLCDCLALVATRAVHLVPADSALYAAAVKYLLPQLLTETSYELSTLLGAQFHTGSGAYGAFRKNVRDLPMIGLGAAGTAACRATVVPQLPRLARDCWLTPAAAPPPAALFRLGAGGLPPLDLARLTPAATADPLMASLTRPPARPEPPEVTELGALLLAELARLRDGCAGLDAGGRPALADPRAHALADRYALVLAGAACLGVWRAQQPGTGAFLAGAGWLVAALTRLLRRLGGPPPGPAARQAEQDGPLLAEVLARYRGRRSFDLYDTPLAGAPAVPGEEGNRR